MAGLAREKTIFLSRKGMHGGLTAKRKNGTLLAGKIHRERPAFGGRQEEYGRREKHAGCAGG
jgi:hypothetical protein